MASRSIPTTVFRKSNPYCKLTVYLGSRVIGDHNNIVDPVEGVVLIDPEYIKDKKVFVALTGAFRIEDRYPDVVLLGIQRYLHTATLQIFPPIPEDQKPNTPLQEKLLNKLGPNAYPFMLTIPQKLPSSVTLLVEPENTSKVSGIDYRVRAYCAKGVEEKVHWWNSVELVIRKVKYAPEILGPPPRAERKRGFLLSDGNLHLEAFLDKRVHFHGDPIHINVVVINNSNKTVKKVKVSVRQHTDIYLSSIEELKFTVAQLEADDQIPPNSTFNKVYTLTPMVDMMNQEKRGLALGGRFKNEHPTLASSSLVNEEEAENHIIVVCYKIKVKLSVSFARNLAVKLPFILMHPKPAMPPAPQPTEPESDSATEADLIDFDSAESDPDEFAAFARLRLEGFEDDGERAVDERGEDV